MQLQSKQFGKALGLGFGLLLCGSAWASGGGHWGYTGHESPEHWGELDPAWHLCGSGKNQTPIDIGELIEAELAPITFSYTSNPTEILNNGHTIQVNYAPGSFIEVSGRRFELKQFHFHTPSENWVAGESFPMEGHLVHADADGQLAVVGVMYQAGEANPALADLWAQMPKAAGEHKALSLTLAADAILPADRDYYRFNGSLTTPPCSEGVWWLVMKNPASASEAQMATFTEVMHGPNNRPLQAVNARPVLQ